MAIYRIIIIALSVALLAQTLNAEQEREIATKLQSQVRTSIGLTDKAVKVAESCESALRGLASR